MKKIYFLAIIFFIIFGSNNNLHSSCPTGYNSGSVTMTIGSCNYEVHYCYRCGLSYPGDIYITEAILLTPNCIPLPLEQVLDQIYTHINNPQYFFNVLCPNSEVVPCDEIPNGGPSIELHWTYCWQVKFIQYFGVTTYQYIPCENSATCNEYARFCYDVATNSYIKTFSDITISGYPDCIDTEVWEITFPTQLNQVSECFIYRNTPCDF